MREKTSGGNGKPASAHHPAVLALHDELDAIEAELLEPGGPCDLQVVHDRLVVERQRQERLQTELSELAATLED